MWRMSPGVPCRVPDPTAAPASVISSVRRRPETRDPVPPVPASARRAEGPRRLIARVLCLTTVVCLAAAAGASDWPQFLGPNRDGVYTGDDLADAWPAAGPPQVWERPVGEGFSNPVVANGRVILFHREGDQDVVEALDAETGREIWSFSYPTNYRDNFGFSEGPRASPVVVAGQVYTFGAQGMLHCLQFVSGRKIWSLDTHREFGVRQGFFGASGTPLVEGPRIFLNVGGSDGSGLIALDKDTGHLLWKTGSDEASYASPVTAQLGGQQAILFFTRTGLVAARPRTGEILLQHRWRARSRNSVNAATPIVVDDAVFLSTSYGTGATVVRLEADGVQTLWASDEVLTNHYATSVQKDGVLYGFHGRQEYSPSFRAVEWKTGKVRWSEDRFGGGSVMIAGDRLLIQRENGELVMAAATPERFEVISRAQILQGTVRAYAALADGLYYVRNRDTLVCVNLKP